MKAQVKVNATTIIEVEAAKQKDLVKAVASATEVFGEKRCGLCGSTDIRLAWRTATKVAGKKMETYEFPEWQCQALIEQGGKKVRCGAKLSLGTVNDDTGTLFPQRKLILDNRPSDQGRSPSKEERENGITGSYGPHNGWTRYRGPQNEDHP